MLIADSVALVSSGTALVDNAGDTMHEVVASVRTVTEIVGEISDASDEQSHGIVQVNQVLIEMDKVTQQNSAMVHQAASAAASLQEQSAKLAEVVGLFVLPVLSPPLSLTIDRRVECFRNQSWQVH